ncbi:translocation/assembly module TamB domain-containing protein [Flammeovirga aprica]|uniref:Translocation and assembly module TamB C-terminal domain-containing protein n=1 Tax=Flammeovirga aprica JL-4 TaxID=694437 RepID=A0A7X9NZP8_9BACT|nr:translocation/assembly module TamB domain-containing protein [Flammeovirga aprica]NME66650.1 hypothetical protein [Flammeovirga aprica JL-4]
MISLSQLPVVQTYLIHQVTSVVTKKTAHPTTISSVKFDWFDKWTLEEVKILDLDSIPLIEVESVVLDFSFITMLYNEDQYIHVEETVLNSPRVEMIMDSGLDSMNSMTKWIRHLVGDPKGIHRFDYKEPGNIHLVFEKVKLKNGAFIMLNPDASYREKGKFDVHDMEFSGIYADVTELKIVRDTIAMEIKNLNAVERRTQLKVYDIDTYFAVSTTGLSLHDLDGDLGSSTLKGNIDFIYDDYTDYNDFYYCVGMDVKLKQSTLHTDDLASFFTYFDSLHDYIVGDFKLKGTVNDFVVNNADLRFGGGSTIKGDFQFNKVIDKERTVMDLSFHDSYYFTEDLVPYVPAFMREYINMFGAVALDGTFKGTLEDFELDGILNSDYGVITPKMDISIPDESYEGYLKTDSLDLGEVFDNSLLGELDFEGDVKGKGFSVEELSLNINASIKKLGVNGYNYSNIYLDSTYMKEGYFNGELVIKDPNLKFYLKGLLDFNDSTFKFQSGIDIPNFKKVNLSTKDVGLYTRMEASFDKVIDNGISGGLSFYDSKVFNKKREIKIEQLMGVTNIMPTGLRLVNIESDFMSFNMAGFFDLPTLTNDVIDAIDEGYMSLFEDSVTQHKYYAKKKKRKEAFGEKNYSVDAELSFRNVNDVISIFTDSIQIADNTKLILEANFGKKVGFHSKLFSDHLHFYGVDLDSNYVNYFAEKDGYSSFYNTSMEVTSKAQDINGFLSKDFRFSAFTVDQHLVFDTGIDVYKYGLAMNLKGDILLDKDSVIFRMPQSNIFFEKETWTTIDSEPSKIIVYQDGVHFVNFNVRNKQEVVYLNGWAKKNVDKPLHLKSQQLDLSSFNKYLEQDVRGRVDSLDLYIEDVFVQPRVYGHVAIDSLSIDDYFLGDLKGESEWTKELLTVNLRILDDLSERLNLSGNYYPQNKNNQLDMKLEVNDLPLGIFQPFIDEVVEKLEGKTTGWVKISGNMKKPKLWGSVFAKDGLIRLVYLGVDYVFGDTQDLPRILIRPTKIYTENLRTVDEYGHYAYIDGGINFKPGFEEMTVGLDVNFDDFFIMKKPEKGNDLFYGTAFGTGNVNVSGPFDDIIIDVNATTNKRTKIYIPLNEIDYSETDPYIVYIQRDTVQKKENIEEVSETVTTTTEQANFQMKMNLEITPDAYCELIFDKKTGDIIRGNGLGKIQMNIDKNREFEMFGNVEIVKGAYNFTMKVAEFNLVDKKFVIDKGSTLSWNGDPYEAQMNIVAKYEQRVSLLPLIDIQDSTVRNAPEIVKRYPADVDLIIKGDLSNPQLAFDIDIHDYPATVVTQSGPISLESYVAAFEERIHRDEQELNRQVFGLIVMRQLLSNDSYGGFGQTASSSVSELLTNQLSYILSQVDDNFEIDLDMSGLDREALQNLQMRLSYTFAQGKVRVTRDGGFTDNQNQTTAASVLGDWTVEVVLSQDGALRAKFYQKYRQDVYLTTANQDNTSLTGASVMHTKSFDNFKQITSDKNKQEKTKRPKHYRRHLRKLKKEEKRKKNEANKK